MSFRNTQADSLSSFETHSEPKSLFQVKKHKRAKWLMILVNGEYRFNKR